MHCTELVAAATVIVFAVTGMIGSIQYVGNENEVVFAEYGIRFTSLEKKHRKQRKKKKKQNKRPDAPSSCGGRPICTVLMEKTDSHH